MSTGDAALIEAISKHIERRIGRITCVFHELESKFVHIDVHYVAARRSRPYELLVTSGMSERPMPNAPSGREFAEMVAILPAGVAVVDRDGHKCWPMEMLVDLARHPHAAGDWMGVGHSMSNNEYGSEPFVPSARLNSVILLPPLSLPARFSRLRALGRQINFMAVVPLYEEELQLKLRSGTQALLQALARHRVTDVIDPRRVNVALCD